MTLREFLRRLEAWPSYEVRATREPDGSVFIECERGYRDTSWTTITGPIDDDDTIDDEIARAACRDLGIPPTDVGL